MNGDRTVSQVEIASPGNRTSNFAAVASTALE